MNNSPQPAAKGFTRAFYVSNTVELFETHGLLCCVYRSHYLLIYYFRF